MQEIMFNARKISFNVLPAEYVLAIPTGLTLDPGGSYRLRSGNNYFTYNTSSTLNFTGVTRFITGSLQILSPAANTIVNVNVITTDNEFVTIINKTGTGIIDPVSYKVKNISDTEIKIPSAITQKTIKHVSIEVFNTTNAYVTTNGWKLSTATPTWFDLARSAAFTSTVSLPGATSNQSCWFEYIGTNQFTLGNIKCLKTGNVKVSGIGAAAQIILRVWTSVGGPVVLFSKEKTAISVNALNAMEQVETDVMNVIDLANMEFPLVGGPYTVNRVELFFADIATVIVGDGWQLTSTDPSFYEYPPAPMTSKSTVINDHPAGSGTYVSNSSFNDEGYVVSAFPSFKCFNYAYIYDYYHSRPAVLVTNTTTWQNPYTLAAPHALNTAFFTKTDIPAMYTTVPTFFHPVLNTNVSELAGDWVELKTPVSVQLRSYMITGRRDTTTDNYDTTRTPGTWHLLASNDNGASWTILHSKYNYVWLDLTEPQQRTFTLETTPGFYNLFRLVVTNLSGGGGVLNIGELRFRGKKA